MLRGEPMQYYAYLGALLQTRTTAKLQGPLATIRRSPLSTMMNKNTTLSAHTTEEGLHTSFREPRFSLHFLASMVSLCRPLTPRKQYESQSQRVC